MESNLATNIEALLFALGRPLSHVELAKMLEAIPEDIDFAIAALIAAGEQGGRGIVLVDDGRSVELRVTGSASELIARVRREELSRDLGRAGAEVIAILLYKGPSSRAQIDFIRGVNSSAALRTLSVRGLVRRVTESSTGSRSATYELTADLLAALGVSRSEEAPEYGAIREHLETLQRKEASEGES